MLPGLALNSCVGVERLNPPVSMSWHPDHPESVFSHPATSDTLHQPSPELPVVPSNKSVEGWPSLLGGN